MNYRLYSVKGLNPGTGRQNTIKIEVPINRTPQSVALEQGKIVEPFEVTLLPFREPSESQLSYAKNLGIRIPKPASLEDVSALISFAVDSDREPNQGLIDFATNRGFMFSIYIGKKALYNLLFNRLSLTDKIAFFVFCVYRYLSDDRQANLDRSPHFKAFYAFAEHFKDNKGFVTSMEKYAGEDLRFFGKMKVGTDASIVINGGSTNTTAYKLVAQFLNTQFGTPLIKTKAFESELPNRNKRVNDNRSHAYYDADRDKDEFVSLGSAAVDNGSNVKKGRITFKQGCLISVAAVLGFFVLLIIIVSLADSDNGANQSADNETVAQAIVLREYIEITADDLQQELKDNAARFAEMYENQYVAVTGVVERVTKDCVYLKVDGNLIFPIYCRFGSSQKSKAAELNTGDIVTMYGKCGDGGLGTIDVKDCKFEPEVIK